MFLVFQFKCTLCARQEEKFIKRSEVDDTQMCSEHHPPEPMIKLPPGTRTTFRFADNKLKT